MQSAGSERSLLTEFAGTSSKEYAATKQQGTEMIRTLSLVTALLFFCSTTASAESYNVATIDVNQIMNQLDEAKDIKAKLDQRSAEARKKIEGRGNQLKELETELKEKKASPDSDEVEDFRTKAREFERMVKDAEEEIRREFLKENQKLTERVLAAVESYAKKHDIQLVLDKGEAGRSPVIFGNPSSDITAGVMKELNN